MDNFVIKFLAILVVIFSIVVGFGYTHNPKEHEVLSYSPQNKSGNFSLFACNLKNLLINFTSLNVTPDPIVFDRDHTSLMNVSVSYIVKEDISTNKAIEVDIRLQLKTPYGFTEVCELIGEEKCHIGDLMKELQKHGVTFPLTKGTRTFPRISVTLPTLPFILRGRFVATLDIKQQGKHLGCFGIRFCITGQEHIPLGTPSIFRTGISVTWDGWLSVWTRECMF